MVSVALAVAQDSQTAESKSANHSASSSDYLGSDVCKTCHEDLAKHFEQTAHFATVLDKKATAAHQGCEACHGPGKAHVDGGGDVSKIVSFKKLSGDEASRRCFECHSAEHEQGNFLRSAHATADVGCTETSMTIEPRYQFDTSFEMGCGSD